MIAQGATTDRSVASSGDDGYGACRARPAGRAVDVTVLAWAIPLSWLAFVATVVWRPNHGQFNAWLDVGVYDVPFALAAVACWRAATRRGSDRTAWRTLGYGFVVFIAGNVYGSLVVGEQDIYPSPADAMWLSFYVLLYASIVGLVRSRVARFQPSTWLDGGVGGFGVAALVTAFALGPALTVTDGTLPVVATNLAYPAAEVVLIVILVASATAIGARGAAFWLMGLGIVTLCVTDITYLFMESAGTYAEGGLLDIGWPLAMVFMGWAACSSARPTSVADATNHRFVVPVVFITTSVGLLVYGQRHAVPAVAVALAGAALGVAAIRVALTFREVQALAESRREARTDELTGLPNRRLLIESLDDAVADANGTAALLIVDLDRFKEVNDSLGHVVGDLLLHDVGQRLIGAAPPGSVLARLGGDEFAVLVRGSTTDEGATIGRHIRAALLEPFGIDGMRIIADASVGVACSPEHGTTATDILARADIAMYRAKRLRTGVETFDVDVDTLGPDRFEMLADLRSAFDGNQFALHYQPQLNLRTGAVVGVEALVRWHHPERGLVPPDQFLPLLEQTNSMTTLTAFVLRRAIADGADLCRSGHPLRISVNISASDLVSDGLAASITQLLAEHQLGPELLVVEVTEDTVMADRVRSLHTLHLIREEGVNISVDDYGTGRASLSYIRDLPITELKLDRSFLEGIPVDAHNAAIVRSTIELAHALALPLVAEGVEDSDALDWLRSLGCDLGQGYHISRPLPFAQLVAWLTARAASAPVADTATVEAAAPVPVAVA